MRKLISLIHLSLDGFCSNARGGLDWVAINPAIFDDAIQLAQRAGAAVYGRTTYQMMHSYWPGVLRNPDSGAAERGHARWVENVEKITFSRTLDKCDWNNTELHRDAKDVFGLKEKPGKDLLIFGSPGLVKSFQALDAIDEYWLFLNPVLLGEGTRFFEDGHQARFRIAEAKRFDPDVMRFHYVRQ